MKTTVTLLRAVGSEFIGRILRQTWWIAGIIGILLLAGGVWLTNLSSWWWILVVLIAIIDVLIALFYILAWFTIKALRPKLSETQKDATSSFVDKFETVLETVGTPFFLIPIFLLWDMIRGHENNFIETAVADSAGLKDDFTKLHRLLSEE